MDAVTILQSYVDEIGAAVLSGDWETYRRGVALPFNLVTQAANIVVETEARLREGFDVFVETLISQRITEYVRLVQSADLLDADLLSGVTVTHMMSGGSRIVKPFASQLTLRHYGSAWKAVSISSALTNPRWPLMVPSPADNLPEKGTET